MFCEGHQLAVRVTERHTKGILNRPRALDMSESVDGDSDSLDTEDYPVPAVSRLGFKGLHLEPEYLLDRLRHECALLRLPCEVKQAVASGAELMRLDVDMTTADGGVRMLIHVVPQDFDGAYSISFTRLSGDTFQFHSLYRTLRASMADLMGSTTQQLS